MPNLYARPVLLKLSLGAVLVAGLTGCGGGSDSSTVAPTKGSPASAAASDAPSAGASDAPSTAAGAPAWCPAVITLAGDIKNLPESSASKDAIVAGLTKFSGELQAVSDAPGIPAELASDATKAKGVVQPLIDEKRVGNDTETTNLQNAVTPILEAGTKACKPGA